MDIESVISSIVSRDKLIGLEHSIGNKLGVGPCDSRRWSHIATATYFPKAKVWTSVHSIVLAAIFGLLDNNTLEKLSEAIGQAEREIRDEDDNKQSETSKKKNKKKPDKKNADDSKDKGLDDDSGQGEEGEGEEGEGEEGEGEEGEGEEGEGEEGEGEGEGEGEEGEEGEGEEMIGSGDIESDDSEPEEDEPILMKGGGSFEFENDAIKLLKRFLSDGFILKRHSGAVEAASILKTTVRTFAAGAYRAITDVFKTLARSRTQTGQRIGTIDLRNCVKIRCSSQYVFAERKRGKNNKVAVACSLDASASMDAGRGILKNRGEAFSMMNSISAFGFDPLVRRCKELISKGSEISFSSVSTSIRFSDSTGMLNQNYGSCGVHFDGSSLDGLYALTKPITAQWIGASIAKSAFDKARIASFWSLFSDDVRMLSDWGERGPLPYFGTVNGTQIGLAITTSVELLKRRKEGRRICVIFTDGEVEEGDRSGILKMPSTLGYETDTSKKLKDYVSESWRAGIEIYCIRLGTPRHLMRHNLYGQDKVMDELFGKGHWTTINDVCGGIQRVLALLVARSDTDLRHIWSGRGFATKAQRTKHSRY